MAYRGAALRALREAKEIQIRQISEETRITSWYLQAIEEEHFERFPGRFYFKSFTAEYIRSLGLDPGEVLPDLEGAYDEWLRSQSKRIEVVSRRRQGFLDRLTSGVRRAPRA